MMKVYFNGKHKDKFFTVSEVDYQKVIMRKWYLWKNYIYNNSNYKKTYLHRYIMEVNNELTVDHINGDTFNNQRENLRVCTHSQNCKNHGMNKNNTSGFKGVIYRKDTKKYAAHIKVDYKYISLGCYNTAEQAAKAYEYGAEKYFGEYKRLWTK